MIPVLLSGGASNAEEWMNAASCCYRVLRISPTLPQFMHSLAFSGIHSFTFHILTLFIFSSASSAPDDVLSVGSCDSPLRC